MQPKEKLRNRIRPLGRFQKIEIPGCYSSCSYYYITHWTHLNNNLKISQVHHWIESNQIVDW